MPGTFLKHFKSINLYSILYILSALRIRRLSCRGLSQRALGHTASELRSQDPNSDSQAVLLWMVFARGLYDVVVVYFLVYDCASLLAELREG